MTPDIYSPDGLRHRVDAVSAIHLVMAKYYEGVEEAKADLLDEVFHPEWLMRDTDTPDAALLGVEGKGAFMVRVVNHGPYPGYAEGRVIASLSVAYDQLAFVRVIKNASQAATDFFLYKIGGRWAIMDKVWINPRADRLSPTEGPSTPALAGDLLKKYFKALGGGDRDTLSQILHVQWDLKFIEPGGALRCLGKEEFLLGVGSGVEAETLDHSRLLSLETCQDGMAVARVDLASRGETRFLAILRVGEIWKIVAERRSRTERE